MKSFLAWLDRRTGFPTLAREVLHANIPGGARWSRAWGGALLFFLAMQFLTGVFLWLDYSPGAQTAWESVDYIQNQMSGGWLVRGLHHYTAQILPVLLVLHLAQVVIGGAYKAPREVNFWTTLLLFQLVMFMALTGYQLPWDQKGFWATKVAMSILGIVPLVGQPLQRILIGGADYGHLTLTRFFALHAGVLPATVLVVLLVHFMLFRRHGFAGNRSSNRPDAPFWPDQALKISTACLAVMATLLFLILRHRLFSTPGPLGAELGAPADPTEAYSAARPEWYFLFLYQFLKLFPSGTELIGAIIIPSLVAGVVFLMPFLGKRPAGHRFNVCFLAGVLAGAALLTFSAINSDAHNPAYQSAVKNAQREAERAVELANAPTGVPASGAIALLRADPFIQGPKLFAKNCASCHRYAGHDGLGGRPETAQSASDLAGFGSRAWITGLLDPASVSGTNYFGGTKFKDGKMAKFVKKDVAGFTPAQREHLQQVIMAVSAEAHLKSQSAEDQRDTALISAGQAFLKDEIKCTDCHAFRAPDENADAPDLTGYGSRAWMVKFLTNPGHADFYGDRNDRMPAFGDNKMLAPEAIGLLADWLRGDWYVPAKSP